MKLYPLAIAAGLLPLFTIHLCYLLAAQAGHVPTCIPYFHSCTSISAAGRTEPEYYLFKALMIPAAVIIFAFWIFACQWLQSLACPRKKLHRTILVLSLVANLGLILYSVMLGEIGSEFRVQRRVGVMLFFSFSFIVQILFVYALNRLNDLPLRLVNHLRVLKVLVFAIGSFAVAAIVISSFDSEIYDSVEDAFEWWVTLILCLFSFVVARMWKRTDFRSIVSVQQ